MGLISKDPQEIKTAMLMMGELVLKDLQQTPMQSPLVYYLECTRQFVDNKDTNCFLPMDKGDNLISFEPPFVTTCYGLAPGWVYDAPPNGM